jgi:hypothetical protein
MEMVEVEVEVEKSHDGRKTLERCDERGCVC